MLGAVESSNMTNITCTGCSEAIPCDRVKRTRESLGIAGAMEKGKQGCVGVPDRQSFLANIVESNNSKRKKVERGTARCSNDMRLTAAQAVKFKTGLVACLPDRCRRAFITGKTLRDKMSNAGYTPPRRHFHGDRQHRTDIQGRGDHDLACDDPDVFDRYMKEAILKLWENRHKLRAPQSQHVQALESRLDGYRLCKFGPKCTVPNCGFHHRSDDKGVNNPEMGLYELNDVICALKQPLVFTRKDGCECAFCTMTATGIYEDAPFRVTGAHGVPDENPDRLFAGLETPGGHTANVMPT